MFDPSKRRSSLTLVDTRLYWPVSGRVIRAQPRRSRYSCRDTKGDLFLTAIATANQRDLPKKPFAYT
jgi:hypothetical protein